MGVHRRIDSNRHRRGRWDVQEMSKIPVIALCTLCWKTLFSETDTVTLYDGQINAIVYAHRECWVKHLATGTRINSN